MAELSTDRTSGRARLLLIAAALLLTLVGALAVPADHANAKAEVVEFDTEVSTTQAGGHPDVSYSVQMTTRGATPMECNCADPRIVNTHFPTGFIGNPHAIPICTLSAFSLGRCAPESQVGVLELFGGNFRQGIYNLQPHTGEPGLIGFLSPVAETAQFVVLHARTGSDYGLDATSSAINHLGGTDYLKVRLWGVPAAAANDANRFPVGLNGGRECPAYPAGCYPPVKSSVPPAPYLQNPTTCGVPLTAAVSVEYYSGEVAHAEDGWPATTGCDQLTFDPSLSVTPTTNSADSPVGLDIAVRAPQPQSPTTPSPSEIRNVVMTLPAGLSLNPAAANGKTACQDSELLFDTENEAECPEFAKIGTASIDSSALPGPIDGSLYIGQPLPNQTYRLFVTGNGFGTHVKLKGSVDLDPSTGQIVTRFIDLPQSPIQGVDFHFFGSERGIFQTPTRCGSYAVTTRFTPWNDALEDQTSTSAIEITSGPNGGPCPGATRPFAPEHAGGTADNTAGAFSPFTLRLSRRDGDQEATGINVETPPGFLASLRGLTECPESSIALLSDPAYGGLNEPSPPECPSSSRVGAVTAGAGPGTRPVYVSGDAFIAGPYKGAPVSIVTVLPAVSGPYDFGNVVVRIAIHVDPRDTRISAISDPLPQILEGVPLRVRYIQLRLDRPGFTLNPTRCDPFAIHASSFGSEGAVAASSTHFQVANCSSLGYEPSLRLRLSGGLRALGHPQIHAVLRARPGDANSRRVSVTLPKGELLDNDHIRAVCTRVQFAADSCPESSRIGRAEAESPLLDAPLAGWVYLRSSSNRLPDLVLDLRGRFDIEISGRVDAIDGRLRTTFEDLPDAPVSSVTFDLFGGAKGLVINSDSLCGRPKRATVHMTAQSGAVRKIRPRLTSACTSKAGGKGRFHKGRRG